ncbi:hypothetical protein, variant [Loa loa]|uniref:Uncharacterized protein n=1 Tax=Loa loa TaxID=7209 RepID=A0A1I7VY42_LOALO|nr:hypothetical protein, variant [Loa loa]EJD74896.1 hypothetical protein, variant [Loa loa]
MTRQIMDAYNMQESKIDKLSVITAAGVITLDLHTALDTYVIAEDVARKNIRNQKNKLARRSSCLSINEFVHLLLFEHVEIATVWRKAQSSLHESFHFSFFSHQNVSNSALLFTDFTVFSSIANLFQLNTITFLVL